MFLVDTNVVSELARPAPNGGVLAWAAGVDRIALSVVTVDEVAYGLAWRANQRVADWWERFLRQRVDVLDVTLEVAKQGGALRGALAKAGRVRTQADMWIAATALAHGFTLVTRNTRDFEGCGIAVLDPFRA